MKRLWIKLAIAAAAAFAVNLWFCGRAATCGAASYLVSVKFEMTLCFVLLQAVVTVTGLVRPCAEKAHRTAYWLVSEALTAATVLLWGFIVNGPFWRF